VPATSYADPVVLCFILLPLALVGWLVWRLPATRARAVAAIVAGAWMGATWAAAASGFLRQWEVAPPPFLILPVGIVALATALAMGSCGRQLIAGTPLWMLVGVQGFRLPLELAMHALADRGIMPPQMTYTGWNFDILTGVSALIVAALAYRRPSRAVVMSWNLLGLLLLVNIVTIAIVSTPRVAAFGPDRLNTFITYPPFVWLPAVMVLAALAGHLVIFRALREARQP
jgi:hypothetical protein